MQTKDKHRHARGARVIFFTQASVAKPELKNANLSLTKRWVMVRGVPCVDHRDWGRECNSVL